MNTQEQINQYLRQALQDQLYLNKIIINILNTLIDKIEALEKQVGTLNARTMGQTMY